MYLVFPPPRSLLTSCFPPSLNASHLIVTWVEANHTLGRKRKKKPLWSYCPKQKQQVCAPRRASRTHKRQDVLGGNGAFKSGVCLCASVCLAGAGVVGWWGRHIVLYSCTLPGRVASKSRSLAILGPDYQHRSQSAPAKVLSSLRRLRSHLLCIITQVIVE